jgi:RNA polymerase sigma factor, sigma-70 family
VAVWFPLLNIKWLRASIKFFFIGVEFRRSCVSLYYMTDVNDIEPLFKAHYSRMLRLSVALLHDDDLARDIVHDVFLKLLEGAPGVAVTEGYLLRSVRNRCLNHIRNCEIHRRIADLYFLDNEEYDSENWPDEETIARIDVLIRNDISSQSRRVMELRFSQGLPFNRIAGMMGISETAVYRHLSHALAIIRKKLNENG